MVNHIEIMKSRMNENNLAQENFYSCMKCGGRLNINDSKACCIQCNTLYPISDGIIIMDNSKPNFLTGNSNLDDNLQQLLILSKKIGCIPALRKLHLKDSKSVLDYRTNLSRVDFKYLLPLSTNSNVLEIGSGGGLISLSLAKSVRSVYSLEKVIEHAKYIRLRADQEDIKNLFVASGGKDCVLPYLDNSFDIVIMNGVFEWLGFESTFDNVKNIQKAMLAEVHRVLKDRGALYLTTLNKLSIELNLSKNVHNNNIIGAFLLPDRIRNRLAQKIGNGKEYLSGLQTLSSYSALFKEIDFNIKDIWIATPNFRYPGEFIDLKGKSKPQNTLSNLFDTNILYRCQSLILPWCFQKRTCLSYAYVLSKSENKALPSIIQSIVSKESFLHNADILSLSTGKNPGLASSVTAYLQKNRNIYICKIARFGELPFLSREYENMKKLYSLNLRFSSFLPKVLSHDQVAGFDYTILPYYKGYHPFKGNYAFNKVLYSLIKNKLLYNISFFLTELAVKTKKKNFLFFDEFVENSITKFLETTKERRLQLIAYKYLRVLKENWSQIPLIYSHNDLSLNNLIVNRIYPFKIKILDWEGMVENGLPAVDLMKVCEYVKSDHHTQNNLLRNYCSKLNVNINLLPGLKFLKLIKSREKLIKENMLDRTARWDSLESSFIKQLLALDNNN
jgi:ubiquinone/menaquinone biosynthesis C-methylase UbiE